MAKIIDKYIMAISDFENTSKLLAEGGKVMPKEAGVYKDFFDNIESTFSDLASLNKFIKKSKLPKKECMHYWEGLITLNFTLLIVEYVSEDENFVENACDNELLKFISRVI